MGKPLILFLIGILCAHSQSVVEGHVKDIHKNISFASVVLKDSSNGIVAYTYTNESGYFTLTTSQQGNFKLHVSSLGYSHQEISVDITDTNQNLSFDILLEEKTEALDEIIIQSDAPIKRRNDTISIKTKFFVKGDEQTVEDLLQKIPGLNIDAEGTIRVGNKEIEKLMVEGDDFFDKGYKVLSKNMPAHPIEEIEILNNFSENPLLKRIENSEKVALNLKLKESAKRVWFGNLETAHGNDNFYELRTNLMNFGKRNKYYILNNFNSIGYDAVGDIDHLIKSYRIDEPASIGDNQSINSLLSLEANIPFFKPERTHFNNAELASLNAIFNPSEKLKIKAMGFFNWDEIDFYRNSNYTIDVDNTNFTNTEDYQLRHKKKFVFGKLDMNYQLSKNQSLNTVTKFNRSDFNSNSQLFFNTLPTRETLHTEHEFFDQKISYTQKISNSKALLVTGRFINEKQPQYYKTNQFLFTSLFPEYSNAEAVHQQSENQYQYAGVEGHLFSKSPKGHLLEFKLGNQYRNDKLQTIFSIFENQILLATPEHYQNELRYTSNDLYLKGKYQYKLNRISVIGQLGLHNLYNRISTNTTQKQTVFYVVPSIGINWSINERHKLLGSYTYNTTNATSIDVLENYWMTGYRSLSKGLNTFNQLNASSLLVNYQLGNWSDRFFANTFILYTKNHDYFSTNTYIEPDFVQSEKIRIKDNQLITVNTTLDYYFKYITSNLKVKLSYTSNDYENRVNLSEFRTIVSSSFDYGFEIRSAFSGRFNYHLGSKWSLARVKTNTSNSFTNNNSFLNLLFNFNKRLQTKLQTEFYHFGNLQNNSDYYFVDFNAKYAVLENKLNLSLIGKNLLNTKTFRNYTITDLETSKTEYRLLPWQLLLKLEYRF